MKYGVRLAVAVAAVLASTGGMLAQGNVSAERVAMMRAMGSKMAPLMGMIQGRTPYDAAAATAAATELAELAAADWAPLFPEGSDADSLGAGKALPVIWTDMDGFLASKQQFAEVTAALAAAAGQGVDAMRPLAGPVGASCGSCHEAYRK